MVWISDKKRYMWLQDWFCEYAQWNVTISHPFTPSCVA